MLFLVAIVRSRDNLQINLIGLSGPGTRQGRRVAPAQKSSDFRFVQGIQWVTRCQSIHRQAVIAHNLNVAGYIVRRFNF